MSDCKLCLDRFERCQDQPWNDPLFESPNFIVLPSLGALVEGWLLLVPKQHFICIGALPELLVAEMQGLKQFVSSRLQQIYGPVCVFEHGPSTSNLALGCGVDHAHLHIVPVAFDLVSAVGTFLPESTLWSMGGVEECQHAFQQSKDYLYLEQPVGVGLIAMHQRFEGQLFRRAIASRIGSLDQFNWREFAQIPNVSATIEKLRVTNKGLVLPPLQFEVAA